MLVQVWPFTTGEPCAVIVKNATGVGDVQELIVGVTSTAVVEGNVVVIIECASVTPFSSCFPSLSKPPSPWPFTIYQPPYEDFAMAVQRCPRWLAYVPRA
jgi:hypothetical protein